MLIDMSITIGLVDRDRLRFHIDNPDFAGAVSKPPLNFRGDVAGGVVGAVDFNGEIGRDGNLTFGSGLLGAVGGDEGNVRSTDGVGIGFEAKAGLGGIGNTQLMSHHPVCGVIGKTICDFSVGTPGGAHHDQLSFNQFTAFQRTRLREQFICGHQCL